MCTLKSNLASGQENVLAKRDQDKGSVQNVKNKITLKHGDKIKQESGDVYFVKI